ncbi:growth/differentiation factor 8-like [Ptychodera flava]|uniref:growth/differentiation factor 8-like n=1 Tax=Ptychodera flava TaxID=63121 RepID=UPI003969F399
MKFPRLASTICALIYLLVQLSVTVSGASIDSVTKGVLISNGDGSEEKWSVFKNVDDRSSSVENDSNIEGEFVHARNGRVDDYLRKLKKFQDRETARPTEVDGKYSPEIEDDGQLEVAKSDEDEDGNGEKCTDCQSAKHRKLLEEDELVRLRLKRIKQQILDKLQLTEPPNVTERVVLPKPLAEEESDLYADQYSMNIEDFYGKTTQVIIFAETDRIKCHPKSPDGCFQFRLSDEIMSQANTIQSAEMWLYKITDTNATPDRAISIAELSNRHSTATKSLNVKQTSSKDDWVTFDVKHIIRKWQINGHADHSFVARCEDCPEWEREVSPIATDEDHRPFLVIDTAERRSRIKRDVDCIDGMSTCCRKEFYVSFREINWHDWILQPKGFFANYCDGSCAGSTLPRYHHTSVMQRVSMTSQNRHRRDELTPCCTPTKLSPLSLLYYTNGGTIVKKNLPNMKVDSCGCS